MDVDGLVSHDAEPAGRDGRTDRQTNKVSLSFVHFTPLCGGPLPSSTGTAASEAS